jgi:hypothetical protein
LLRRYCHYLKDVFEFGRHLGELTDDRVRPQISTATVWLAGFMMFVLRKPSLNALENDYRGCSTWRRMIGSAMPSADTVGRVYSKLKLEALRWMLVAINKKACRNKAIHQRKGQSHRVVAVDGHEMWASRKRCCGQCLVRKVRIKNKKDGKIREVKEYYHRIVVAQWVGCTPPPILDFEMVRPKEGEVVAAKRLLKRILADYPRLIDVISADALYLEAPFIKMVIEAGKHVVVVMKQAARDLYEDAQSLRSVSECRIIREDRRTTHLWDLRDLSSFTTLGQKVRVVWAEERTLVRKVVPGSKPARFAEQYVESTWVWVTTLPDSVPAIKIQQWGHDRWDLENRGFNELVSHWHMDHCFIHNTVATEAFLLTLAVAFVTTYLFYERNLKHQARPKTRLALAHLFSISTPSRIHLSVWPSPG